MDDILDFSSLSDSPFFNENRMDFGSELDDIIASMDLDSPLEFATGLEAIGTESDPFSTIEDKHQPDRVDMALALQDGAHIKHEVIEENEVDIYSGYSAATEFPEVLPSQTQAIRYWHSIANDHSYARSSEASDDAPRDELLASEDIATHEFIGLAVVDDLEDHAVLITDKPEISKKATRKRKAATDESAVRAKKAKKVTKTKEVKPPKASTSKPQSTKKEKDEFEMSSVDKSREKKRIYISELEEKLAKLERRVKLELKGNVDVIYEEKGLNFEMIFKSVCHKYAIKKGLDSELFYQQMSEDLRTHRSAKALSLAVRYDRKKGQDNKASLKYRRKKAAEETLLVKKIQHLENTLADGHSTVTNSKVAEKLVEKNCLSKNILLVSMAQIGLAQTHSLDY